jgi:hypothetical protein
MERYLPVRLQGLERGIPPGSIGGCFMTNTVRRYKNEEEIAGARTVRRRVLPGERNLGKAKVEAAILRDVSQFAVIDAKLAIR